MTSYIVAPPPEYTITVTRGADCLFTMNRVDINNNPIDWNSAVSITVDVDRDYAHTVNALVAANQAAFIVPAAIADQVHNNTRWRMYMQTTNPTIKTAAAVGTFQRDDGGCPTC